MSTVPLAPVRLPLNPRVIDVPSIRLPGSRRDTRSSRLRCRYRLAVLELSSHRRQRHGLASFRSRVRSASRSSARASPCAATVPGTAGRAGRSGLRPRPGPVCTCSTSRLGVTVASASRRFRTSATRCLRRCGQVASNLPRPIRRRASGVVPILRIRSHPRTRQRRYLVPLR